MKKFTKKLVAIAVLIIIIAIIVSLVLLRQDNGWSDMTYEQYNALSAAEQEEFFNSFETIEDFFAWYNKAKEEYEKNQDYTEIGEDGTINIGEGGKNE